METFDKIALLAKKHYICGMSIVKPNKWEPPVDLPLYDTCVIRSIAFILDKSTEEVWKVARPFWHKKGGITNQGKYKIISYFGYTTRIRGDLLMTSKTLGQLLKNIDKSDILFDTKLLVGTKNHLIGIKNKKILDTGDTHNRSAIELIYEVLTPESLMHIEKEQQAIRYRKY